MSVELQPADVEITGRESVPDTVLGKSVPTFVVKTNMSLGAMTTWETEDGDTIKGEMDLAGLRLTMVKQARQTALDMSAPFSAAPAGGEKTYTPPTDFAVATAITPDKALDNPRRLRSLRVTVSGIPNQHLVLSDRRQEAVRISDDSAVFVNPPESAETHRTSVQCGDVLLTITGSRIGRVAPVTPQLQGAYISQHVAILRLDQTTLVPEFVSSFLALESGGQRQIARTQYGQTKPGLNLDQIRKFRLPVPPIAKQLEFLRCQSTAREVESDQHISLAQLDILFETLQDRAFQR